MLGLLTGSPRLEQVVQSPCVTIGLNSLLMMSGLKMVNFAADDSRLTYNSKSARMASVYSCHHNPPSPALESAACTSSSNRGNFSGTSYSWHSALMSSVLIRPACPFSSRDQLTGSFCGTSMHGAKMR